MKSGLSSPMRSIPSNPIKDMQPHSRVNTDMRASIHFKGDYVPVLAIPTAEFGFGQEEGNKKLHYRAESKEETIDASYKLLKVPTSISLTKV